MSQPTRYRRPSQSSYAKGGWWVANFAELLGGIAGLIVGILAGTLLTVLAPGAEVGWLPWVTTPIGALGLRALIKRPAKHQRKSRSGP